MFSQFSELKIVVNDILLTYYRYDARYDGKKTGKTLLFLHGWATDSTLWFQPASLIKNHCLLFLDLPGFGKSQNPPRPFSIADFANTVDMFIKKLTLKNVVVIGHSFGGKTAIKLATQNPSYLSSLILVDSSCFIHRTKSATLKIALAKTMKPFFNYPFMRPWRERILRKITTKDVLLKPDMKETFAKVVTEDLKNDLSKIKKKTLVVWGVKDNNAYTPIDDAYRIHDIIKGSRLATIPDAGHFCFLEKPEKFVDIVQTYL